MPDPSSRSGGGGSYSYSYSFSMSYGLEGGGDMSDDEDDARRRRRRLFDVVTTTAATSTAPPAQDGVEEKVARTWRRLFATPAPSASPTVATGGLSLGANGTGATCSVDLGDDDGGGSSLLDDEWTTRVEELLWHKIDQYLICTSYSDPQVGTLGTFETTAHAPLLQKVFHTQPGHNYSGRYFGYNGGIKIDDSLTLVKVNEAQRDFVPLYTAGFIKNNAVTRGGPFRTLHAIHRREF